MAITTPEYRQFTRQTYIASTERDGGLSHLWHMNRLAHIRLDPSPGIEGYREVDFRHPEAMSDTQARHVDNLMGRHDRLVKAKERELVAENKTILNRLLLCESDSHRLASHHNLFPSKEEMAKYDKLDDQLFFKQRDREEKFKKMDKENKVLLRHLVEVQPGVRTAKELDAWYHNVHKKRVQTLSRFKPIEPFAGANILRRECSVRFPNERRGSKWALLVEPPDAFRPPLVCGRPHPPIPISEAALSAPESIQPSTTTPVGTTSSKRAPWQGIAKNDIPLMHYASDLALVHDVEFVTPPQESGCTRMWRDAIRSAKEKYSNRKRKELQAVSSRSPDSQLNAAAMNDNVTRRYSQRWGSSTEDGTPRTKGDFDTRHLANETSPNQQRMMDAGAHFLHHSSPGSDKHPTESPGETSGWNSEFNRPLPSSQQSPSELRQFTQRSHSRSMTSNRDVAAGRRGLSTQQSAQGPPSSESRTNGGSLFHPSVPREGNVECGAFGQSGHSSRAAGSSIRQYTAEDAVAVPGHRSPDMMENQRPSQRGLSKTFSAGSGKRNFASPTEAATASDPFEAMMAEWNRASRKSSAGVKYIPL